MRELYHLRDIHGVDELSNHKIPLHIWEPMILYSDKCAYATVIQYIV
jgi:hypothetical protein